MSSLPRAVTLSLAAAVFAAIFGVACSASNDNESSATTSPSGGNPGGTGGAGGGLFTTGAGAAGPGVGGGCAGTSTKAEKIPLDMYIMLDQSGSMDESAGSGTKWDAVTSALTTFVQQPNLDGISVGLQYFGLPPGGGMACNTMCQVDADCGSAACGPCFFTGIIGVCLGASGGDSCNAADYAVAEVEIAPLPGVAQAIIGSMANHAPSTGTPTSAALDGAIQHARAWQLANPSHVTVAVLATDGLPQACDTDLNNINAIAAAGANGMPQVLTYVIGVGSETAALNGIAVAGGTGQAFLVDASQDAAQQFLDAMNAIRGTALSCNYLIPVPMSGTPDYGQVNVQYTPGNGGPPVLIPKVGGPNECPASGMGWYYDNETNPTQIILCATGCDQIAADTMGQIDVVLGCQTFVE